MKKRLLSAILCCLMILSLTACGTKPEANDNQPDPNQSTPSTNAIVIKASCTQNSSDNLAVCLEDFCNAVTERTNGAIVFEFHPNGELGTLAEVREMLISGAPIILSEGADNLGAYAKDLSILNAPYTFKDFSQIEALMESDWYQKQMETVRDAGIQVLSLNWTAGQRCMVGNKKVAGPDDCNGVIIRCPGNEIFTAWATHYGMSPVTSNWNEVYTGLSNKVFDMAEANIALLYSSALSEVSSYLNLTYHNFMNTGLIMSSSVFDSLTPEQQQILIDASTEFGSKYWEISQNAEAEAIEKFRADGVTVVDTDVDAMFAAGKGMYDKVALSDELKEYLANMN